MATNNRFLASLWIWVGFLALLLVVPMVVAVTYVTGHGQPIPGHALLPPLFAVVAVAALLLVNRWRFGDRRLRQLLQAESPEPLVAFYHQTIRPGFTPHGDLLLAHSCALAYVLYGDYPAARATLEEQSWDEGPPLVRAGRTAVEALLCYFDTHEYVLGLNLSALAQGRAATHPAFPGARVSAAAYESYVEIGEVLCGRATDRVVASLEEKLSALPTLGQLLVAWGLAIAHRQRGEDEPAAAMRTFIREVGPHCRALQVPPASQVRAAEAE